MPRPKLPMWMMWCLRCCQSCQHVPKCNIFHYIYSGPFAGGCYPLGPLCPPPPWLTNMLYTMYYAFNVNRKLETQIFFSLLFPLGLKNMSIRKGLKKNPLFKWNMNHFLMHVNPLRCSFYKTVDSYPKKFPTNSSWTPRRVQTYLNPLVTVSAEICESLIHKNEVCFSNPKTEI